jgi:hypothetical protein
MATSNATVWQAATTNVPVVGIPGLVYRQDFITGPPVGGDSSVVLTLFNYAPATNTLLVFVNGLLQNVGYSYIEASSNTINFPGVTFPTNTFVTVIAINAKIIAPPSNT